MTWTLCIVSNASTPFGELQADVSVFNANGTYMGHGLGGVKFTLPNAGSLPGIPSFIVEVNSNMTVDPKDLAAGLSNSVVVLLYWKPCVGNTEATCAAPDWKSRSFNATADVQ